MKTIKLSHLNAKTERQNLILKIIVLKGLVIASIFFAIGAAFAKDSQSTAQKLILTKANETASLKKETPVNKSQQTFPIVIKTGRYKGQYSLKIFEGKDIFQNRQCDWRGNLAPNRYVIDNTGAVEGSTIDFTVEPDGRITSLAPAIAADVKGGTITFKTAEIKINPAKFGKAGGISALISYPDETIVSIQPFDLIIGLRYRIDTVAKVGNSDFQFMVNQHGKVKSLSKSAKGYGHSLKYNTVKIKVDPKDPQTAFQIKGFGESKFKNAVTLPFIPLVVVKISYNGKECLFTVAAKGKTVSGDCAQDFDFAPK